jgi:hypothetical protein
MVTIDGWQNPFYRDQNEGLERLFTAFAHRPEVRFFLRVHPNLRGVDNSQTRALSALADRFANVEVIAADSPVSTYALLAACDIVLAYGSTVGIEALYHGKPSIVLGRAMYEDLDGLIKPESHQHLIEILEGYLRTGVLPRAEGGEEAAIKYGFYQMQHGHKFRWARARDFQRLTMCRQNEETVIKPGLFARLLNRVGL